jgi:hypothetical protein
MKGEVRSTIKQFVLSYDPQELRKWREGDRSVVPPEVLNWKGPGRQHGYAYGEFFVKRFLKVQGHQYVTSHFDLVSAKSKYVDENARIEKTIGTKTYSLLRDSIIRVKESGIRIENPDLCIIDEDKVFFAEVKKGTDKLRPPQRVFALVVSKVANLCFCVYKLIPVENVSISEVLPL